MDAEQITALQAAVTIESAVECDGLRVTRADDGYRFSLPDVHRRRLDEGGLDEGGLDEGGLNEDGLNEDGLNEDGLDEGGLDEDDLERVARANAESVTNWYFWHEVAPPEDSARYAFLRYLERIGDSEAQGGANEPSAHGGDGIDVPGHYETLEGGVTREWGQLLIATELADDGYRRYEARHVDDADAAASALEDHEDVGDARDIATFDERDRYRPLKSAPTLRRGWRFPALTSREVVAVVESFYPATIENWHRDRQGELDVDHWTSAIARQTGMYGVVETWDRGEGHEHVERVAVACCSDSECLKRREWEYDEDTDLDADPGDGVMPCREPCSMVVSAARTWTKLEGETPQTYEFELTPSEKEQLEAIVDAVADGHVDEIREADFSDPANRIRARYLRAKRFDDDGDLSGVPTDRED